MTKYPKAHRQHILTCRPRTMSTTDCLTLESTTEFLRNTNFGALLEFLESGILYVRLGFRNVLFYDPKITGTCSSRGQPRTRTFSHEPVFWLSIHMQDSRSETCKAGSTRCVVRIRGASCVNVSKRFVESDAYSLL